MQSAKCHNHPSAPAIEQCSSCQTPLCGMCANFVDDVVLCEKCEQNYQSEKFVSRQTRELERPEPLVQARDEEEPQVPVQHRKKANPVAIQISVIVVCGVILAARLLVFPGTPSSANNPDQVMREQEMTALAQCLLTFRQIGVALAEEGIPPTGLRCPDNAGANIVRETENDIIVTHPQPELYGFSRIEVSRLDPEPRLTE